MKIKYNKIGYLLCGVALLGTSCKKQLDINDNPALLRLEQVSVSTLLPSTIQYTSTAFWNIGEYGNFYSQYFGGNGTYASNIDSYNPYGFDATWASSYLSAMPNLKDMITKAEAQGAPQYAGIGKLLMALNLMQATDIWGDLPYKEAFKAPDILAPHYDTQQEIYTVHLKALLDGAIADLAKPVPALASLKVGVSDIVYGGVIDNWKKAAYGARARYYLHLAAKDASALAKAASDADMSFSDQTGKLDLQLKYTQEIPHPWYNRLSIAKPPRYARPSKYIVNLMNGDAAGPYAGLFDARLPLIVDNGGAATYIGRPIGTQDNEEGAQNTNVDITEKTFYGQRLSAVPIITYAEVQFIKAEALFNTDKAGSYTAYLNGIKGSMQKFGVAANDITTYTSSPLVAKGSASFTLSDIMLQKYIALFIQMESWTDMRRYQYDPTVYIGIKKPFRNILGDVWVQRGNYPDNEPGRNPNVPKVLNQAQKLWLFTN